MERSLDGIASGKEVVATSDRSSAICQVSGPRLDTRHRAGISIKYVHLQQRSERVLQPSLQQHQSSVPWRRPRRAETVLVIVATAMKVAATSEVLGKCMIDEIVYVCVFLFVGTVCVWHFCL